MLGRISELNKQISAIKQQKWQVEEEILKLELRLKELEKLCTRSPAKPDNIQLDFANVKLKDMRNRIDHVVKYLPTTVDQEKRTELDCINKEFKHLATEHKEIEEKLTKPLSDADRMYADLRKEESKGKLHQMRFDISKKSVTEKIASISQLDGMVSMPILMQIIENIKKINSKAIFDAYQAAFGRKINDDTKRVTIEEIWNYCSLDIKGEFEKLTGLPINNLKAENVIQLMNKLSANFDRYLQQKFKLKIINNDSYQKFLALLKTDIYLFCVLETYKFTDSLQMGEWGAKLAFSVSMNENDVVNPYKAVAFCGSAVTITPETENLFCELVYWLKGLYLRSFSLIPPFAKDGEKVTELGHLYICDKEDEQFYSYKKLTKFTMAEKHKLHYESLMTKIPESKLKLTHAERKKADTSIATESKVESKEKPAKPSLVTPVAVELDKSLPPTVPLSSLFTAEEFKNLPFPSDMVPQPILWRLVNNHYQLTITLPNDEGEKLERLKSEIGKVMEEGVVSNSAEMQAELKSFQDAPDDVKIKKLKECFHKYTFSHTQTAALRVIPHLVREYFKNYSEGKRYGFFANQHSDVAKSTVGNIGLSDNPRTHLEKLFSVRKELNIPGDESKRLLPQLDKILLTAYDILCTGADKEHEITLKQIAGEDGQNNGTPDPIKFITKPNYSQIIIYVPQTDAERWNKLQIGVGKIMEHGVVEDESKMREELEVTREGDIDEKIKNLKNCIRKYEMSNEQQASLGYLTHEVDEKFKPYLARKRFFGMWNSTHHGIAETTKNDIVSSVDPRIHLEKLIKLRKTLMKEKVKNRSQNLLPVIDNILLDVYDLLIKPRPLKTKNSGGIRG